MAHTSSRLIVEARIFPAFQIRSIPYLHQLSLGTTQLGGTQLFYRWDQATGFEAKELRMVGNRYRGMGLRR